MEKDMTAGSPAKIIWSFTLPIVIGNIFQQFYSMVDTVIVGKFVGTKALAAVGSTGTICFLILGFLMGMTAGFTVLTSQRFGAGDMAGMRKTVGSASVLAVIVSVIMTVVSMAFMKPLLILMNTPEDIFQDAYAYIMIICGGIFAQVLYNLLAGILRALGNSKVPLYFLLFSALLNIVLDLVLIIVFHMGAAGAAYATVISQGVSGVLCLIYIIKKVPLLKLEKSDFKPDFYLVRNQLAIGFPMALQFSITAIGAMMVQSALNALGSLHVAAFTAASKIEQVISQMYVALGTTMATYSAQNIGAGKVTRIREGFRAATVMSFIYAAVTGILTFCWGYHLTGLFVSENLDSVVGLVNIYLRCVAVFFIPLAVVNIYRNGIQGMGFGLMPMMAGVAELVGRGVVAVIASRRDSYLGICMASPIAWILAGALLIFMYWYIMKKLKDSRRFE
ncbi:MAG: MATE family efflux transporter [Clostridiales bacterium]|nr:MATE family efflux transporter [Clostridiales bacterium]